MISGNVEKKRLFFSISLKENLADVKAVFIAVGIPPDKNGRVDLQYVLSVFQRN